MFPRPRTLQLRTTYNSETSFHYYCITFANPPTEIIGHNDELLQSQHDNPPEEEHISCLSEAAAVLVRNTCRPYYLTYPTLANPT